MIKNKRSSQNTIFSWIWVPAYGSHISPSIKNCTKGFEISSRMAWRMWVGSISHKICTRHPFVVVFENRSSWILQIPIPIFFRDASLAPEQSYDDVIKWKHFPRCWSFVRGIHRSPVNSPHKWPVTRNFDVFFDLRLFTRLSKQWWAWWFATPSRP